MRHTLALAAVCVLTGATAAAAQSVQDRYGPARKPAPVASAPVQTASLEHPVALYAGPMLNWGAKRASPAIEPQPAPIAAPAHVYEAPAPRPQAVVQPAPASIYESPPPPLAAARPAPIASPAPQARVTVTPAATYQSPPPVPSPTVLAAAPAPPRTGGTPARYYSLHRQYGLAPDAAPVQPATPRYVLIGPPDEPAAPRSDDDDTTKKDRPS